MTGGFSGDLTREQREELWAGLTAEQQIVLSEYKREQMNSLFLTKNYLKDSDWLFVAFHENPFYHKAVPEQTRLYCQCGRELKYQYVLASQTTGEMLKLGAVHFSQHIGIDPKIANQVAQGRHTIDRGLDKVLIQVVKGRSFPEKIFQRFSLLRQPDLPQNLLQRIQAFRQVDLPLHPADHEQLLLAIQKEHAAQRYQTLRPKPLHQANKSRLPQGYSARNERPFASHLLKDMIKYIRSCCVGDEIELESVHTYLQQKDYSPKSLAVSIEEPFGVINSMLLLLTEECYSVQLLEQNRRYFRIR